MTSTYTYQIDGSDAHRVDQTDRQRAKQAADEVIAAGGTIDEAQSAASAALTATWAQPDADAWFVIHAAAIPDSQVW